jgi:hypothetical protein
MDKSAASAPKKYKTIPAPAPGSGLRFVGGGSRGGLTKEDAAKLFGPDGQPLPGAPVTVGTGGVWGTTAASITSGYGTCQRATLARQADKEVYPNDDGEVVAYLYYNYRYEGSADLLVPASITALDPGDTISIGGQTLYVDSAEEQWQYRGWKMYAVKASKHDTVV